MKNIISIINILKKTQKINLKKLLFYLIYYLNSFDLKESTRMIKLLIKYFQTIKFYPHKKVSRKNNIFIVQQKQDLYILENYLEFYLKIKVNLIQNKINLKLT